MYQENQGEGNTIVIAELGCAAGKSVIMRIKAIYDWLQSDDRKIVIAVPNVVFQRLNSHYLDVHAAPIQSAVRKAGTSGIFVVLHDDLLSYDDEVLGEIILLVDEFHLFLEMQ